VLSGKTALSQSVAEKRAKLQVTALLPLETRKVARGNTIIVSPKLCQQSSVMPYSTDGKKGLLI